MTVWNVCSPVSLKQFPCRLFDTSSMTACWRSVGKVWNFAENGFSKIRKRTYDRKTSVNWLGWESLTRAVGFADPGVYRKQYYYISYAPTNVQLLLHFMYYTVAKPVGTSSYMRYYYYCHRYWIIATIIVVFVFARWRPRAVIRFGPLFSCKFRNAIQTYNNTPAAAGCEFP